MQMILEKSEWSPSQHVIRARRSKHVVPKKTSINHWVKRLLLSKERSGKIKSQGWLYVSKLCAIIKTKLRDWKCWVSPQNLLKRLIPITPYRPVGWGDVLPPNKTMQWLRMLSSIPIWMLVIWRSISVTVNVNVKFYACEAVCIHLSFFQADQHIVKFVKHMTTTPWIDFSMPSSNS